MKKTIGLAVLLLALGAGALAQKEKEESKQEEKMEIKHLVVPELVKKSFTKDFPGATAKWGKENDSFEANFKYHGKIMSAVYGANGKKMETEIDIKVSELPSDAKAYLAQNYKGQKVKEAAMITRADGEVNYEAEINKMDVLFSKNGKFIKTSTD